MSTILLWGAAGALLAVIAAVLLARRFKAGDTYGSAAFGSWPGPLTPLGDKPPPGLVLGKQDGDWASWTGEGHWLLLAASGAGKSTGVIEPSIKHWNGSMLAVDVKGELVRNCAGQLRADGIQPLRFDPFGLCDDLAAVPAVALDALAPITSAVEDAARAEACLRLAGIIIDPPGSARDAHWAESARAVLGGLLAACCAGGLARPRIQDVLELLESGPKAIARLKRSGSAASDLDKLAASASALITGAGPSERGAILSSIRRQLAFCSSANIIASLSGSWQPAELLEERQRSALFLVLPANRLSSHGRLLRLVIGLLAEQLLAAGPSRERRLLLAIDEAGVLGPLEAIAQGVALFRGFGATFLLAFQDDQQLDAAYGADLAASIRSNCHMACWGVRDLATSQRLSASLGERTVLGRARTSGAMPGSDGASSLRESARPLLAADEIRRLPADTILAFPSGHRPCRLQLIKPEGEGASPS